MQENENNLPVVEVDPDAVFGLSDAAVLCEVSLAALNNARLQDKVPAQSHSRGHLYKGADLIAWNNTRTPYHRRRHLVETESETI